MRYTIRKRHSIFDPVHCGPRPLSAAYYTSFDLGPYPSWTGSCNPLWQDIMNDSNLLFYLKYVLLEPIEDPVFFKEIEGSGENSWKRGGMIVIIGHSSDGSE